MKGFAATAAGGAIALLSRQRGDYHAGTIADGFGSAYSRASGSAEQLAQLAARQGTCWPAPIFICWLPVWRYY